MKQTILQRIRKTFKKANFARVCVFILFFLWCGSFVVGIGWAFLTSLNEETWLYVNPLALPKEWKFENYLTVFTSLNTNNSSFLDMVWNSLWLTFGGEAISLAFLLMAGYSLGNFQFKGRNAIVVAIVILLMIPVYGTDSARLMLYMDLKLYNSPLILITNAGALSGTTLIIMTFFQGLSPAYEEAAKIDGAGYWTVFLKIHLPMIIPSIGALALMDLIARWNNYTISVYYLPDFPTFASGLYELESNTHFILGGRPVYFAGVILCSIPPIIVFSIFRQKIMTSITIGGVK